VFSQVQDYAALIDQFLAGSLSAEEFQKVYINEMKNSRIFLPESEFAILQRLFKECDAYWGEGKTEFTINEEELKVAAQKARTALGRRK
jgi:hypothetical protein